MTDLQVHRALIGLAIGMGVSILSAFAPLRHSRGYPARLARTLGFELPLITTAMVLSTWTADNWLHPVAVWVFVLSGWLLLGSPLHLSLLALGLSGRSELVTSLVAVWVSRIVLLVGLYGALVYGVAGIRHTVPGTVLIACLIAGVTGLAWRRGRNDR